jgi:hypothetical protein
MFLQLAEMKRKLPGFNYALKVDPQSHHLKAAVWVTESQAQRAALFGDVMFFDATFTGIKEKFVVFLPTVVTADKKLRIVGFAVAERECVMSCKFVLEQLSKMLVGWLAAHPNPTIIADAFLSEEHVKAVLPGANLHTCMWHWLFLNLNHELKKTGFKYSRTTVLQAIRTMIDSPDQQSLQNNYDSCCKEFPLMEEWFKFWWRRKGTWAMVRQCHVLACSVLWLCFNCCVVVSAGIHQEPHHAWVFGVVPGGESECQVQADAPTLPEC